MKLHTLLKVVPLLLCAYASSAQALVIKFNAAPGMTAQSLAGFQAAADRWTAVLHDDVTVNLNINFSTLDPGVLGGTFSVRYFEYYDVFRDALKADAWGANDLKAISGLNKTECMSIYMNGTVNNPNGANSTTPFVDSDCDANNYVVSMTQANARAAGVYAAHDSASDGRVSFSDAYNWDFDPSNGIDANAFDFIGVATHEIGHALGFISGVDILDYNFKGYPDDAFTYVAPTDLFRCSADSRAAGADIDWSVDKRAKFFSMDNCATTIATFSTGPLRGDGRQASHWKDEQHFGIMDPTVAYGEKMDISALDLQMYDAIGWNTVPEPGTTALFLLGLAGLAGLRRRAT
jgi:hypothetical protein